MNFVYDESSNTMVIKFQSEELDSLTRYRHLPIHMLRGYDPTTNKQTETPAVADNQTLISSLITNALSGPFGTCPPATPKQAAIDALNELRRKVETGEVSASDVLSGKASVNHGN